MAKIMSWHPDVWADTINAYALIEKDHNLPELTHAGNVFFTQQSLDKTAGSVHALAAWLD